MAKAKRGKTAKAKAKVKMVKEKDKANLNHYHHLTLLGIPNRTTNNPNHPEHPPEVYHHPATPTQHHAANGSMEDTARGKTRRKAHAPIGTSHSVGFGPNQENDAKWEPTATFSTSRSTNHRTTRCDRQRQKAKEKAKMAKEKEKVKMVKEKAKMAKAKAEDVEHVFDAFLNFDSL